MAGWVDSEQVILSLVADDANTTDALPLISCHVMSLCSRAILPGFLASLDDESSAALALSEFKAASNMTEQFGALAALCMNPGEGRDAALADFYEQWKDDNLVGRGGWRDHLAGK